MRTLIFAAAAGLALTAAAVAQELAIGDVSVEHPWASPGTAAGATAGAYLTLRNEGETDVRLMAVTTSAANSVELHKTVSSGGLMSTEKMDEIVIPAGGEVVFEPGGAQLMLVGLTEALPVESQLDMTLTFEGLGDLAVPFHVQTIAQNAPHSHDDVDHSHGEGADHDHDGDHAH